MAHHYVPPFAILCTVTPLVLIIDVFNYLPLLIVAYWYSWTAGVVNKIFEVVDWVLREFFILKDFEISLVDFYQYLKILRSFENFIILLASKSYFWISGIFGSSFDTFIWFWVVSWKVESYDLELTLINTRW